MTEFQSGSKTYEQYLDASAALFMDCYAETIPLPSKEDIREAPAAEVQEKCAKVIKADRRHKKQRKFLKRSGRLLKSVAMVAMVLLSLSSVLFLSVEAVRNPIVDFYTKQEDGHMIIGNSPFAMGATIPHHDAPDLPFDPEDPLYGLLPEGFYLDNVTGDMEYGYTALYFNEDQSHAMTFDITKTTATYHLNTENCKVTEFEISGGKAILSERNDCLSNVLVWYNADLDRLLTLTSTFYSGEELISIAEVLNYTLSIY